MSRSTSALLAGPLLVAGAASASNMAFAMAVFLIKTFGLQLYGP